MVEQIIILKVKSYTGNDTWLDIGGNHIRERVESDGIDDGKGVMYALIHIKNNAAGADWGYATAKEAKETARRLYPNAKIASCD
ncbi:MAG: hypothetical protein ABSE82_06010 [Nitrososphaerales archaeon]|jgi:hypothetical protein